MAKKTSKKKSGTTPGSKGAKSGSKPPAGGRSKATKAGRPARARAGVKAARAAGHSAGGAGGDPAASRIIRRSTIHAGKKYVYENVVIRADDGSELHRQMVKHPGAVTVLPLLDTPQGVRVVVIRNERFAVGRTLVELPAGTLEPGEDPSVSGVRELEEEIGYTSSNLRHLGTFFTTPGVTDEIMWTFAAMDLRHVGQRLEADEKITVEIVTPDEAFSMIDDGRMMDGKSMLALLLARRKGLV